MKKVIYKLSTFRILLTFIKVPKWDVCGMYIGFIKEPIWNHKGTYMGWIKEPNYINIIYIQELKRARRCACAMSATSALEQLTPQPPEGEHFNILYFNIPQPPEGAKSTIFNGRFAKRIIPCVLPQYSIGEADSCIIYIRCVCRVRVARVRTAIFAIQFFLQNIVNSICK